MGASRPAKSCDTVICCVQLLYFFLYFESFASLVSVGDEEIGASRSKAPQVWEDIPATFPRLNI
jgi:hypothetical protein